MSAAKHTPGPWSQNPRYQLHIRGVRSDEHGSAFVASCESHGDRNEDEANARLIAAAPELLEALQQFVDEKVDYMRINHLGDPEATHTVKLGRAALAKAKGEQS